MLIHNDLRTAFIIVKFMPEFIDVSRFSCFVPGTQTSLGKNKARAGFDIFLRLSSDKGALFTHGSCHWLFSSSSS
jgi:hypothetical protein